MLIDDLPLRGRTELLGHYWYYTGFIVIPLLVVG